MEAIRLILQADEPYHHYGAIAANIRRFLCRRLGGDFGSCV